MQHGEAGDIRIIRYAHHLDFGQGLITEFIGIAGSVESKLVKLVRFTKSHEIQSIGRTIKEHGPALPIGVFGRVLDGDFWNRVVAVFVFGAIVSPLI